MTVPAKVVEIEPTTEYEGTVYNQLVVVEFPNGVRLGLFDPDAIVDDQMVGQQKEICIGTLTESEGYELVDGRDRQINPSEDEPLHWRKHTYYGEVVDISEHLEHTYEVELDVGMGTILANPDKDRFPDLDVGDFLKVETLRSDIHDIDNFS